MKQTTSTLMSVDDIKENPINPRYIEEEDFENLRKSIREFPNMIELRPIIIDKDNIAQGGNQRLKAFIEEGYKEVPTIKITLLMLKEVNKARKELNPPMEEITYEALCKEFVIKDNVSHGKWDWEIITPNWDTEMVGGCKDYRTIDMEREAIKKLIEMYPGMISSVKRKANEFTIKLTI